MAVIIEKTINTFIKDYKKEYFMGGPIMLIQIKSDNSYQWIKNPPRKKNWLSMEEFFKDYRGHKILLRFTAPENKALFEELLKNNFSLN